MYQFKTLFARMLILVLLACGCSNNSTSVSTEVFEYDYTEIPLDFSTTNYKVKLDPSTLTLNVVITYRGGGAPVTEEATESIETFEYTYTSEEEFNKDLKLIRKIYDREVAYSEKTGFVLDLSSLDIAIKYLAQENEHEYGQQLLDSVAKQ